jgi:hypothetical protein
MAKRNPYPAHCNVCKTKIRALEGIVEALDHPPGETPGTLPGYRILCPEHMPTGVLDPPRSLDASKLPSIHLDDRRFER